jgi:hypothetical protein
MIQVKIKRFFVSSLFLFVFLFREIKNGTKTKVDDEEDAVSKEEADDYSEKHLTALSNVIVEYFFF